MLICKFDDEGKMLAASGHIVDIMNDVTVLVKMIYDKLEGDSKEAFKVFVNENLTKLSFMTEEELDKECASKKDKLSKMLDEVLDEIIKELKDE